MTADELRELAQKIEDKWWRWKDSPTIELKAADYLRACADALDAGPVAWRIRIPGESELGHWFGEVSLGEGYTNEALYPLAMPAPASDLSEGQYRDMLDAESAPYPVAMPAPQPVAEKAIYSAIVSDGGMDPRNALDEYRNASDHCLGAAEQDKADRELLGKLRRPLRLPEPMTDTEVDHYGKRALMGHLPVREMIRAIEAETMRRVKEANNAAPTPPVQQDDEALEVLRDVMTWIDNWHCQFKDDESWPETEDRARALLAKRGEK